MADRSQIQDAINAGGGLLRLEPCWVPRSFMIPGRRLRLHPDDYYAFGGQSRRHQRALVLVDHQRRQRSGHAADEGLSYVRVADGKRFLLKEAVEKAGDLLIGADVMQREKGWNLLCKFFDNLGPIPHHMHQSDEDAKRVGRRGKPEAYYFPPQYNPTDNNYPVHVHGARAGDDERGRAALPRELEQGGQRDHLPVARVSPRARHRLADQSGHSSRAGLAADLRAAGEQRRVRDVSVGGRRTNHRRGTC